jgi:hypothetical protein
MARRRQQQARFVPRIIFGTVCVAGAVPACAVACSSTEVRTTSDSVSSSHAGAGGHGGIPSSGNFGMRGVAVGAFPPSSSSWATVAASGFGGFPGVAMKGFGGGGAGGGSADGGGPADAGSDAADGGGKPDVWAVAQMGFAVPDTDPALPPERTRRRRAGRRPGARRTRS